MLLARKPGQLSCLLYLAVAHRNILFAALAETPADSDSSPLALLVKRLQDSLSRLDNFEVETTNGGAETGKHNFCCHLHNVSSF
jgi:hypothetical protein